jgi:hypothetical protein
MYVVYKNESVYPAYIVTYKPKRKRALEGTPEDCASPVQNTKRRRGAAVPM